MSSLHLGIDGGNTKTVAVVCDSAGHVRGSGIRGCGDIYGAQSAHDAVVSVMEAIKEALSGSGVAEGQIQSSAFRLAGVDWPEDRAFWSEVIRREFATGGTVSILNDGFSSLRCGDPEHGLGVSIVVGTGPAMAARSPDGREWALSFWFQEALGATGLGLSALRAVCRADLGIDPETELTSALLGVFDSLDVESLLHSFTSREHRRSSRDLATLAPTVLACAIAGDPVAGAIVREQARRLAEYARVCGTSVGYDVDRGSVPIVLAGSVLMAPNSPLAAELSSALVEMVPGGRPRISKMPPVAGAVLDAIAESGHVVDDQVVSHLEASLPKWMPQSTNGDGGA